MMVAVPDAATQDHRELTDGPREAKKPAQPVDAGRQEGDVLARDGKEVVETGGTEVVLHVGRQPLVLAEDDAEHDAPANTVGAAPDRELDAIA